MHSTHKGTESLPQNQMFQFIYLCNVMALTLGCSDIGIRKSEFVAKTQFLWITLSFNSRIYKHPTKNKIKLCSPTFVTGKLFLNQNLNSNKKAKIGITRTVYRYQFLSKYANFFQEQYKYYKYYQFKIVV